MKLHLGVLDEAPDYYTGYETVGEVAKQLEGDYGILEEFYERNEAFISEAIVKAIFDNRSSGSPISGKIFLPEVAERIRKFLDNKSMDGMRAFRPALGIPTKAAKKGVNTRKGVYSGPERPSFIDGGAYRTNLRVWVEV